MMNDTKIELGKIYDAKIEWSWGWWMLSR